MDSRRSYFWNLLILFYDNFVIRTTDFELYPYISVQLANVIACSIAKHASDQHEDYFGNEENSDGSSNFAQLEPSKELVCIASCKYMVEELLP